MVLIVKFRREKQQIIYIVVFPVSVNVVNGILTAKLYPIIIRIKFSVSSHLLTPFQTVNLFGWNAPFRHDLDGFNLSVHNPLPDGSLGESKHLGNLSNSVHLNSSFQLHIISRVYICVKKKFKEMSPFPGAYSQKGSSV